MLIAICDDNLTDQSKLQKLCESYIEHTGQKTEVRCYSSAEEYLADEGAPHTDVLLLDIYLDGGNDGAMDGMALARTLRANSFDGQIVFITSSPEHALDGFAVDAAHYLIKPVTKDVFFEAMRRAQRQQVSRQRSITVISNRRQRTVPLHAILYMEVANRKTSLVLEAERLETTMPLAELLEMANDERFLPCFRGYAVNMQQVAKIEDLHFVIKNGDRIPIAKREAAVIEDRYMNYMFSGEKED